MEIFITELNALLLRNLKIEKFAVFKIFDHTLVCDAYVNHLKINIYYMYSVNFLTLLLSRENRLT